MCASTVFCRGLTHPLLRIPTWLRCPQTVHLTQEQPAPDTQPPYWKPTETQSSPAFWPQLPSPSNNLQSQLLRCASWSYVLPLPPSLSFSVSLSLPLPYLVRSCGDLKRPLSPPPTPPPGVLCQGEQPQSNGVAQGRTQGLGNTRAWQQLEEPLVSLP